LLSIQAPEQQAALLDEKGALMARQAYLLSTGGSRALQAQVDSVLRKVAGKPYFSTIVGQMETPAVAFSPDGARLASASMEPTQVLLWNLTRPGAQPVLLPGYPAHLMIPGTTSANGRLVALAFSPDGKALIAANADGAIGRWDPDDPQAPFVELPTQKGGVGRLPIVRTVAGWRRAARSMMPSACGI
jgi:WD40 repeat protein